MRVTKNGEKALEVSLDWKLEDEIQPTETWESVLEKFDYSGYVRIESGEIIVPNGKAPSENGVRGRDYHDEDTFKRIVREKYGWEGPPASPPVGECTSPSSSSSPAPSGQHKGKTPKDKKRKNTSTIPQVTTVKRSRRSRGSPANEQKNKNDEFWNFKNLVPYLKVLEWKYENARNNLKDWCYVLPGRSQETGKYLEDFFYEENEVVNYVRSNHTKKEMLQLKLKKDDFKEESPPMDDVRKAPANVSP